MSTIFNDLPFKVMDRVRVTVALPSLAAGAIGHIVDIKNVVGSTTEFEFLVRIPDDRYGNWDYVVAQAALELEVTP